MSDGREYELKFAVDPAEVDRVFDHPALSAAFRETESRRLVSTYFDTPNGRLRRHKVVLRVRRSDEGLVLTVKRTGGSKVDREEWEQELYADQPDFGWLRKTPLKRLMTPRLEHHIAPCFSVDVSRAIAHLEEDGTEIEGAVDRGTIKAGHRSLPVCEFELEMKRGSSDALYALARRLVADLPLVLSMATKSERGHALSDGTWGRPNKAIAVDLAGMETIAAAFESIVQDCLHTLLKSTALIADDVDGEAVHDARIAIRRLRAVLAVFEPVLRRKLFPPLRDGIKWMSDLLGEARDADVILTVTIAPALEEGAVPGIASLATVWDAERRRAWARLTAGLASPRWRVLLVDLLFASSGGVRGRFRTDAYGSFVLARLETRRKILAKRARDLGGMNPVDRHDVRKSAKMLRYALEFFQDADGIGRPKRVRRLGAHLQSLQQALGTLHDDETMRDRFRATFVGRGRPVGIAPRDWTDAAFAAGMLAVSRNGRKRLVRAAVKAARGARKTRLK